LSAKEREGESGGRCRIYYKKKRKPKLSWNDRKEEGGEMMSKEMASSDEKLINTNSMQLIGRNLFLPALFILKHKIITIDHTGAAVDDGILHDLA